MTMTSARCINMADNAANVTDARKLAITQLIVGSLLLCFGIGEQALKELGTRATYFGIWAGILVSRSCKLSNVIFCTRGVVRCRFIERDKFCLT